MRFSLIRELGSATPPPLLKSVFVAGEKKSYQIGLGFWSLSGSYPDERMIWMSGGIVGRGGSWVGDGV